MIYKFKEAARVPAGVTPDAVMAELDAVEAAYGKASPENAAEAVIKDPDGYPALRAFCPATPEEAYREGVRRGVTYAIRIVVEIPGHPDGPEIRARFLVSDEAGDKVWEPIRVITENTDYKVQLIGELRRDAEVFSRKMRNVLAEIERLLGG